MPRWKLIPVSGFAVDITHDIYLNSSLRIGRNVSGQNALTLPPTMTQFSGIHCRVYADLSSGTVQWFVEDTSTNGTFVDGERIVRNTSVRLMEGCRLRLSSPPQETLEFEFVREEVDDERGDNYSHYSRPQHLQPGLPHHRHQVSQYAGGHYPSPGGQYTSAVPLLPAAGTHGAPGAGAAGGGGGAPQGSVNAAQLSHAAFGRSPAGPGAAGAGAGAGGGGGGSGALVCGGGGESTSAPSNPQAPAANLHKRKVNELVDGGGGGGGGDDTAVTLPAVCVSAAAPNHRNIARRMNPSATPASRAGGGGAEVTMSIGMPPMGMGHGGTAAAAMASTTPPLSTAVPGFYPGHGGMAAALGAGSAGGAGAAAEALVHVQAQMRAEKSEKEGLKRQVEALRRECEDASRNLMALREQHAQQLDRSANERQMFTNREESLRSMLAAAEARAELASRQVETAAERARGELTEAETARRHAEAQLVASREEVERLTVELRAERLEASAQRERAGRLHQQVEVEKASAAATRRMAEQHEAEVRAARTQAEEEQRGRRAASEEALSLRGQVEEMRRQLAEAHERISGLQDELAARHHRLCELSKSHAQAEQLLSGLQQTVASLSHMHSSLSHQYAQALAASEGAMGTPPPPPSAGGGGPGSGGPGDGPIGAQQQAVGPHTEVDLTEERTLVLGLSLVDNAEGLRLMMQQSQLGGAGGGGGGGMLQAASQHLGMGRPLAHLHNLHPPSTLPNGYSFPGGGGATGPSPTSGGHHPGSTHPHAGGGRVYGGGGGEPNGLFGHGGGSTTMMTTTTPPAGNHSHAHGHADGSAAAAAAAAVAAQNLTQQLHIMSQNIQQHLNHPPVMLQQLPNGNFIMMSQPPQLPPQQQHLGQGTQHQYFGESTQGATGRGSTVPAAAVPAAAVIAATVTPPPSLGMSQPLQQGCLATRKVLPYPGSAALTPLLQHLPPSQQLQQELLLGPRGVVMDGTEAAADADAGPSPGAGPAACAIPGTRGASQLPLGTLPQPSQQHQQVAPADGGRVVTSGDVDGNGGGGSGGGAPSAASASQHMTPTAGGTVERRGDDNRGAGKGGGGSGGDEDEGDGDGYMSYIRIVGDNNGGIRRRVLNEAGAVAMDVDEGAAAAIAVDGDDISGGSDNDGGDVTPRECQTNVPRHHLGSPHREQQSPQNQFETLHATPIAAAPPVPMELVSSGAAPDRNAPARPLETGGVHNATTAPLETTPSAAGGGGGAAGSTGTASAGNVAAAWPRLFSRRLTPSKITNGAIEGAAAAASGGADGGTPASRPRRGEAGESDFGAAMRSRAAIVGERSEGGDDALAPVTAMTRTTVVGQGGRGEVLGRSRHSQSLSQPMHMLMRCADHDLVDDGAEPHSQAPSPQLRTGRVLGFGSGVGAVTATAPSSLLREWQQYGVMAREVAGGCDGGAGNDGGASSEQLLGLLRGFAEGQQDSLGQLGPSGTAPGASGGVGSGLAAFVTAVADGAAFGAGQ